MSLNASIFEQAWLARDAAFDGRFFVGVRTTGIYCRCICPVRLPYRRNVEFLPSATAAELAGYRPCLRCRPETAPFCPAWKGSAAIVERAVRLIREEGALDITGATVGALAARVGVGERQLSRLFRKHLGASPIQVAKTARVQCAKRLLTETELPITDIASQNRLRQPPAFQRGLSGGLQAPAERHQTDVSVLAFTRACEAARE